ncbi:CHAT domain-containing protein [Ulvibacter antarcticus]|uniref:Tetratricopeptide repeat protein n=1 Tax=Ulvibacter antarcticus TaxID=442714 RepID=A0A3L9YG58_9FLAO|nr:CHAT domain-containing tetratricopeptide repeat protein [Ulvibacter antarcticus]RMA58507.1 tetratricopeptide repeat protein [Ulvibacter antarcticus]
MKSLLLLSFIFSSLFVTPQLCDFNTQIREIDALIKHGDFKNALIKTSSAKDCNDLSTKELITLLKREYQAYRNNREFKEANNAILFAKETLIKNNLTPDFDLHLLLAENYAATNDPILYKKHIKKVTDSIASPFGPNYELQGRLERTIFQQINEASLRTEAINHLLAALEAFDKLENPPVYYYYETLGNLGNRYRNAGDFDKSNYYYFQGRDFLLKHYPSNHYEIAYFNYRIASVYYEKMEYESALTYYLQAREVWIHTMKPQDKYMRYLNEAIGDMYWELEDPENALLYFNYSIEDEKKVNNDLSTKTIGIADSLINSGNYATAIDYYNEAYKWREKELGKNNVQTGACKNFVARALRFSGDTEAALIAYQEAIQILVPDMRGLEEISQTSWYENPSPQMKVQSSQYLFESLIAKGDLLKEYYLKTNEISDLEAALQTYEATITLLENQKSNQLSEASREFWTQRTLIIIESSITTALELFQITNNKDYLSKAFSYSERSKALLLLASLYDQEIRSFTNVSEAIISEEIKLKSEINDYAGKIQSEESRCAETRGKMLSLWVTKLDALQNEYDILIKTIQEKHPEYYNLKYESPIATVAVIQDQILDVNTAMISYFAGSENSYVFLITSEEIAIRKLEDTPQLFKEVSELFTNLSSQNLVQTEAQKTYLSFTETSSLLYNKLLKPELSNHNFSKLIIIPDGKLYYLPFEILLKETPINKPRGYRELSYLLKEYAISYSPSASIKLLVENDRNSNDAYFGFAPNYEGQLYMDAEQTSKTLSLLHFNKKEIESGASLFKGRSEIGKLVTEDLLKDVSSEAGILHLAMHGAIEDEHPLLSKLYFNSSEGNDGMLHIYEIYNLNIKAQLVILSACNSASGKLIRGEGIASLERAFQYAGSKALLSTLWTVDDEASLQLTKNFLTNIREGNSKDVALQNAKLQYLKTATPENLHPFYWSSFKLTGNTEPLAHKSNTGIVATGIAAITIILGVIFFRRKKRSHKLIDASSKH